MKRNHAKRQKVTYYMEESLIYVVGGSGGLFNCRFQGPIDNARSSKQWLGFVANIKIIDQKAVYKY